MRKTVTLTAALLMALVWAAPAGAGDAIPLKASAEGWVLGFNMDRDLIEARCADPDNTWAVSSFHGWGPTTHLGKTYSYAEHCSYIEPFGTYGEGHLTLIAANGDQLFATYGPGSSTFSDGPVVGFTDDFVFYDGTGRFEGATGGGTEVGWVNLDTGEFGVEMDGHITYDASSRRR